MLGFNYQVGPRPEERPVPALDTPNIINCILVDNVRLFNTLRVGFITKFKHVVVQEANTGHFGSVSWRGRSEAIKVEEPGNNDGIYGKVYVNSTW